MATPSGGAAKAAAGMDWQDQRPRSSVSLLRYSVGGALYRVLESVLQQVFKLSVRDMGGVLGAGLSVLQTIVSLCVLED